MREEWTPSEIEAILASAGKALPTLAGRTPESVRQKAIRLGVKFSIRSCRWSAFEIMSVKLGRKVPGRSEYATRNMIARLGLKKKRKPRPSWLPKDECLLKKLREKGMSAKEIRTAGFFTNLTVMAIQKKICWMGLSKKIPTRILPKENRKRFKAFVAKNRHHTPAEILHDWNSANPDKKVTRRSVLKSLKSIGVDQRASLSRAADSSLKKFLIKNWAGKTPDELMEMWNSRSEHKVTRSMVVLRLNQLGLKVSISETRSMNSLRAKELEILSGNKDSVKVMEERIRANRVKLMISRMGKNKDIFTGMELDNVVLGEIEEEEALYPQ
jgi:hypothetical protein